MDVGSQRKKKSRPQKCFFKQSVDKHNKTDKSKEVREKRNAENTMDW